MEAQATTFQYAPLDESKRQIRLLHLLPFEEPGDNDLVHNDIDYTDEIHCTFSIVSLDDGPEYEALSYVWGETGNQATVYLDGHSFPITKNLYHALFHMRQTTMRILWADALCINQSNVDERSSQVFQMGSVFAQASQVVVYLGAWGIAGTAFRLIEALAADPLRHYHDAALMLPLMQLFGSDLDSDIAKVSLEGFFSLQWWSRVWTVQEYALARKASFQSGHHLVSGDSVFGMIDGLYKHRSCCVRRSRLPNAWLFLNDLPMITHLNMSLLLHFYARIPHKREGLSLYIIAGFRDRQCSNPLDKIYGFLGLTNESFRSQLQPDYNLTPRAVYTTATVAWILESKTLNSMSYVGWERDRSSDIPSFVVDLSAMIETEDLSAHLRRCRLTETLYQATRSSTPSVSVSSALEAMTKAVIIDTIEMDVNEDIYHRWILKNSPQGQTTDTRAFLSRYESPSQACWQTLCGGIHNYYLPHSNQNEYRWVEDSDYTVYQKWQAWDNQCGPSDDIDVHHLDEMTYIARVGRNFAVTNTGYLGLVPEAAQPGDHVVLMPGGRVPYVLRRVSGASTSLREGSESNTARFEFIGDCYIHGIMLGEAWDESKLEEIVLV
ncbi:hypothetical protein OPT61_g8864 [Boeremia exigua]|uniref:Uncharacterized protein n=1 Tax=Boeremia exigua TaxID=749465 RepID=A0ACC2HXI0_9PLEO|nr:hypothetical protein OPT61_g8864 [Boeremia exigua]